MKNEIGRSMIEMLGVLAIMGVLSVIGILGYTIAISKYKANEAANQVGIVFVQLEAAALLGKQGKLRKTLEKITPRRKHPKPWDH